MKYRLRWRSTLEATVESAWTALTDYASYSAWAPDIVASEVLVREGNVAILELRSVRRDRDPLVLEVVTTEARRGLRFSQSGLLRHRGVQGAVALDRKDSGVELIVDLQYHCPIYRRFSRRHWRDVVSSCATALQARARRLAAGEVSVSLAGSEKILEVFQRSEGLEVWIRGESYWMASR